MQKVTDGEIKKHIDNILSSREFITGEKEHPMLDAFNDILEDVYNWVQKILGFNEKNPLERLMEHGRITEQTIMAIKVVGVSIIIIFIVFIVIFIKNRLYISKRVMQDEMSKLLTSFKDPKDVMELVKTYENSKDYQMAIRYLFIALLLELNKYGVIQIRKSKTNHQYAMEIKRTQSKRYKDFLHFTDDFNRSWYGNKPIESTSFENWRLFFKLGWRFRE